MNVFSCKQHSAEWPFNTLYSWFVQKGGHATADASNTNIGNESVVTIQATSHHYTKAITVKDVNELLGKVGCCSDCIKDLFNQANHFLASELKSTVGAFLYAATAYDRAQKVTEEGIELERIQEVLEQALKVYQESHREGCLHSVIKYSNVDMINYLVSKDPNFTKCSVAGCLPHKIVESSGITEETRLLFTKSSNDKYILDQEDWKTLLGVESVQEALSMPNGMHTILESDCPFIRGKKVKNTHILVFIPSYIRHKENISLFNFTKLEELIKSVFLNLNLNKEAKNVLGNPLVKKPYWLLMTKSFIPVTIGKTLDYQLKQLSRKEVLESHYEALSPLEAVASILIYYASTKKFLLSDLMNRCICDLSSQGRSIMVGVYRSEVSIDIGSNVERNSTFGLIAGRRFF